MVETGAKRRGAGEGGLYQRASDGKWVGTTDLGWIDGKRKRKVVYGKTKKEAADRMKQAAREQEQGRDLTAKRETVETFLRRWLTDVVEPRLAPKTIDHHRYLCDRHLIPAIGKVRLDKLTPADVTRLLNRKRDDGLAVLTANHMRATLRTALNVAVKWGLVARNVVMATDPVTGDRREIRPLTTAEMVSFKAAIRDDPYETLYRLTLMLGLRIGEALALKWENVSLDGTAPWAIGRPCLRIEWTVQRVNGKDGKTALILRRPKTPKSRRVLPIPAPLIDLLKMQRKERAARQLAAPVWQDTGLVFTTMIGTALEPRNVLRAFHAACETAKIDRHRLHDLRHSAATALIAEGVPLKVVSELLGHSQLATTSDLYGHVLSESLADATDRLAAAWGS